MFVDIVAALLIVSAAALGGMSGSFHALQRLLVVVFALVLAWLIGPELAVFYQGKTGSDAASAIAVGFGIVYVVFWGVIAYGAGRAVKSLWDPEHRPSLPDRLGGAALGLLKGVAVAYLVVVLLVTKYMYSGTPDLGYADSYVSAWVRDRNMLLGKVAELDAHAEIKEEDAEEKALEKPQWEHGAEK